MRTTKLQSQVPLPSYTFTAEGYAEMQQEELALLATRPHAISELQKARALGDLKENGYYQASRQKLNSIDHRLRQLKTYLKYGKIVSSSGNDKVGIGNTVIISDGEKDISYAMVGQHEADPKERKLSDRSPIGKALMGRHVGDSFEIEIPSGKLHYTVKNIQ